jgi:alcohol dehydrogenase class IV
VALITYLTKIQFDFGALALLPEELAGLGIARPLIATDQGVAAAGLLDRLLATLPGSVTATVFDGTPPNPTEAAVRAALARSRAIARRTATDWWRSAAAPPSTWPRRWRCWWRIRSHSRNTP